MNEQVDLRSGTGTAVVPIVPEPQKVTITLTDSNTKDGFTAVFAFDPTLPPPDTWKEVGVLESPAVNALFNLILPALKEEFHVKVERINDNVLED